MGTLVISTICSAPRPVLQRDEPSPAGLGTVLAALGALKLGAAAVFFATQSKTSDDEAGGYGAPVEEVAYGAPEPQVDTYGAPQEVDTYGAPAPQVDTYGAPQVDTYGAP